MNYLKALLIFLHDLYTIWFGLRRRVNTNKRLDGQVVVITGGNTGIGKETAYQLSLRGAKVYIGCRDETKGNTAVNEIVIRNPKAVIRLLTLDLCSLQSVRRFCKELSKLETKVDILVNNAGIFGAPEGRTDDGFELHLGVNHLSHFLLTLHLIPLLKRSPKARVITVASMGYRLSDVNFGNINLRNGAYDKYDAYNQSKLCNVLFSRELAKRLQDTNINAYSLHPGAINTDIKRYISSSEGVSRFLLMTPEMGSQTTLYCALDDQLDNESGFHYENCRRVQHMVGQSVDDSIAHKLWELSADLVALETHLTI